MAPVLASENFPSAARLADVRRAWNPITSISISKKTQNKVNNIPLQGMQVLPLSATCLSSVTGLTFVMTLTSTEPSQVVYSVCS